MGMEKNVVKETQARIRDLKDKKAAELEHIDNEIKSAVLEYEEANKDMKAAMEITDVEAYGEAKMKQLAAKNKKEMYSGRYKQLADCEYLTEAESDRVIDALLDHEAEIAAAYEAEVKEILGTLKGIHEKYRDDVNEAEKTVATWTGQIHANYRSFGASSYLDAATGQRTDRSPHPVPVNNKRSPLMGRISTFLEKMDA